MKNEGEPNTSRYLTLLFKQPKKKRKEKKIIQI